MQDHILHMQGQDHNLLLEDTFQAIGAPKVGTPTPIPNPGLTNPTPLQAVQSGDKSPKCPCLPLPKHTWHCTQGSVT